MNIFMLNSLKILLSLLEERRLRHNIPIIIFENIADISEFLPIFYGNFPIFPTSPARAIQNLSASRPECTGKFSKISPIFRYFYRFFGKFPYISYQSSPRWSWFAGKGCVFQPGSKIVDLGFVKFKSNGTTAKRPLEQIQKTQGEKKKRAIFLVFLGGFEIKRGWIFPEIKWGMDFLRNQTGVEKKNNMIRLVPARIESGRGK